MLQFFAPMLVILGGVVAGRGRRGSWRASSPGSAGSSGSPTWRGRATGGIGEILGVKEASVRVLLFRARQKLAGLLREEGLQPGSAGMDRESQEETP